QNEIIFAIDIYTGKINIPSEAYLKNNQIITKVTDGCSFIFFNSANEIIVTSGGTKSNVNKTTKIFTYLPKSNGFIDKGINVNLPTAFSDEYAETDLLIGIIPGSNGTNYGYYIYTKPFENNYTSFAVAESSTTEFSQKFYTYEYYIIPLNNDLSSKNRGYAFVDNRKNLNFIFGSISTQNKAPDFESIYKRIFKLENASSANSTYMFALIDGNYKFLDSYSMISDNGKSMTVSASKGFGTVIDSSSNQQLFATSSDFQENEKVTADAWKFNNFGYDSDTNLLYFSFVGQKINTSTNKANGYKAKMGYFQFSNASLSLNISAFSNEEKLYSLYSVGYDSYSSNNYYMNKQFENSDPIWLSRTSNQTEYTPIANSNNSFSELTVSNMNLIQQIEDNSLFKQTMPENITNKELNNIISSLNVTDGQIKISKISSDNKTGIISLQVEIIQTNKFGDNVANGNIQYTFKIDVGGYSLEKDFIFKFITTDMVNIGYNDKINKINEIKESTGPS
ncbi:MAG: hypothetical protein K2J02_03870, partial [Malacoplasma sp.]|nr:hypothetical protein [Malacoplasma sp.]